MLTDNQDYFVLIESDDDVFTLNDQALLDSVMERYAPKGLNMLKNDIDRLHHQIIETPNARVTLSREWFASHPMMDQRDHDHVMDLISKCRRSRTASMDPSRYQTIQTAVAEGLMTREAADNTIRMDQSGTRSRYGSMATGLILQLGRLDNMLADEAMLSDTSKDAIADGFEGYDRWERTKEQFRERYKACKTITEKAELRAMFPELADAAL